MHLGRLGPTDAPVYPLKKGNVTLCHLGDGHYLKVRDLRAFCHWFCFEPEELVVVSRIWSAPKIGVSAV